MNTAFYAELAVTTNFSFLRGASHASDLVAQALHLGHAGIGIADRNSVAGVVRAYAALKEAEEVWREEIGAPEAIFPFQLAVGARLVFADGAPDVIAYAQDRAGWGRLCQLLTAGNMRAEKGSCLLTLDDLLTDARGLSLILMPPRRLEELARYLAPLAEAAPGSLWLGADMPRRGDDRRRLAGLKALAADARVPLLAMNDVLYHHPSQRDLQDVLTCIREGTTIEAAGRKLEANAERHLKPPAEMVRLFRDAPEAVEETRHFLARLDFSLSELKYEYPKEPVPPGYTAEAWLEHMTWQHAAIRYPDGVPPKVEKQLREELALIAELKYAPYFLTIRDIVSFAEKEGILCQGRGSAANSAVCYVLGITAVDPAESDLLFARFISRERREPPDIDVDFEHERREEVIQYIYERYGRMRAGIAATVISYRPRSALRDVGKALGLTEDVTARLSSLVWGSWGDMVAKGQIGQAGLDADNPTIRRAVELAGRLLGFPRHLSQHVGGFVLTEGRLDAMVPIGKAAMEDRTFIEWNKDDIDTLALMKVDVLALGMLTCIRKAFDLMRDHEGVDYALADVPREQSDVYDMLCRGDSIGVFQVESRAQINMLPRMKPRRLYDLVIQVAIVRPGPIQGNMVHPYLRRREGSEKVTYPSPKPPHDPDELREVLARTKGVPLFQEQAMKLAMVAAEFTEVEANKLRRAMATFRNMGTIGQFQTLLIERMSARGYDPAFAARCFEQIKGFGEYGFPESHAASFAKLVYISAFIKCRHPAVFAAALLNSQPMGFYAPAQIVRDAREHGVEIRPADINHSFWDNTLERRADGTLALRIGLRQIDGFSERWAEQLAAARGAGYRDIETLSLRARLPAGALRRLADADAFGSLGLDRRAAAWIVRRLPDDTPLPLFAAAQARELGPEPDAQLPLMPLPEQIAVDYQTTRLSLKGHPMGMLRAIFRAEGIASSADIAARRDGTFIRTAGIVLVRQRPGKGNAIFMTLEDETGIVNVLLWARLFERYRAQVMGARLVVVEGRVQKSKEGVIHVMAEQVHDRTSELARLFDDPRQKGAYPLARPQVDPGVDERVKPAPREGHLLAGRRSTHGHPRQVRVLPKSRDFH
ncbi:error-prone DNA polymerase [Ancylobacter sp. WKF20]|uniref:error-prone DNA polymerase n=1 Tax=Ancylobacter sp. WKF20 TaxID=3039801 RepID=UPI002434591B|nr:error-prone DNA polymerase [Ancylobacter sp. WKF20]WGD29586.1 error-prone DNA polymerase [Ancylobacter sp. WKF20]